tara:strand:- start:5019 stop:5222 length:204 start_codon:yes stop_codon:yes gene_type:complete
MPKAKIVRREEKDVVIKSSHRIGGRKSNTSAHGMTNAALLAAIAEPRRARDVASLRTVARLRGLEVA